MAESKQSRIQAPSLQELLTAFSAGNNERPLTTGVQNFERSFTSGRASKRADQELGLRERAASLQEKMNQQSTLQPGEIASAQAGGLPGVPLTKGEASVQKVKALEGIRQTAFETAKPEPKKFTVISEGKGIVKMANIADPTETVDIPTITPDQLKKEKIGKERNIPIFLLREELQAKTINSFIDSLDGIVAKMPGGVIGSTVLVAQAAAKGFLGGDTDVLTYLAQRPAFGRSLYKNFSGDVGNIAQSEGNIGTAMLPAGFESQELRLKKVKVLRSIGTKIAIIRRQVVAFAKANNLFDKEGALLPSAQKLINDQTSILMRSGLSDLGIELDENGIVIKHPEQDENNTEAEQQVENTEDEFAVEFSDNERAIAEMRAELGLSPLEDQ